MQACTKRRTKNRCTKVGCKLAENDISRTFIYVFLQNLFLQNTRTKIKDTSTRIGDILIVVQLNDRLKSNITRNSYRLLYPHRLYCRCHYYAAYIYKNEIVELKAVSLQVSTVSDMPRRILNIARDRETDVKLLSHVRGITANSSRLKLRSSLHRGSHTAFHWEPRCENAGGKISNSRLEVAGVVLNDLSLIKSAFDPLLLYALHADSETRLQLLFLSKCSRPPSGLIIRIITTCGMYSVPELSPSISFTIP